MATEPEPTRLSKKTRAAERADSHTSAHADREPTADEAARAERESLDPDVVEHYEEMIRRGADQQGEGRLP